MADPSGSEPSNVSHLPFGDQAGLPACCPTNRVTCEQSEPLLRQTHTWLLPERVDWNANLAPSGEKAGHTSVLAPGRAAALGKAETALPFACPASSSANDQMLSSPRERENTSRLLLWAVAGSCAFSRKRQPFGWRIPRMGDPPEKPPAGAPRVDDFPAVGRPGEVPRPEADLFQLCYRLRGLRQGKEHQSIDTRRAQIALKRQGLSVRCHSRKAVELWGAG